MAFAYPTVGAPALAAPTVHGYGLSTTPAVLPGVATPGILPTYGAGFGGAGFGAPIMGDAGFGGAGFGAPIIADAGLGGFGGAPLDMYSGYQGIGYDAGFAGAMAPSVYGGYPGTVSGAIAAPVAPARKVWQNGLRRSLVTGHPTRF